VSTSRSWAGSPPATSGTTNAMRVHRLGSPVPDHPQYGRRHDDIPPGSSPPSARGGDADVQVARGLHPEVEKVRVPAPL
jgi:hypothetical protein